MEPIRFNGKNLDVDKVVAVSKGQPVILDPAAIPGIQRAQNAVQQLVAEGRIAYGVTTGFGRFKDRLINPEQVQQLQLNLVRSHAAGVGSELEENIIRALLIVRANTLAKGYSGVRLEVIQQIIEMLNRGVHPVVPAQGSLGASGDLAPLAHLALVIIGEGFARYNGEKLEGGTALEKVGLKPLRLEAKEGLALLNGTAFMVGYGALLVRRAINLALTADIAACLSLEALQGTDQAFDERVHALRPHPRQVDCATFLRKLLAGSQLIRSKTFTPAQSLLDNTVEKNPTIHVQDPYTLRCIPQVHGAVRDAIAYAKWVMDIEINSVNDNPILFVDEFTGQVDVVSAGNFHGEPVAIAMDYMKLALTELGNISERRTARLVDADSNGGVLPMFLTENGGLESGFMIAQYTAAALASENKVLAHPASADSIPSSANVEDHVSMGATAVRQARQIIEHVETIVAIELLCATQGVDFRLRRGADHPQGGTAGILGHGTGTAYRLIREKVPFREDDHVLSTPIEIIRSMVASGEIKEEVEKVIAESFPGKPL